VSQARCGIGLHTGHTGVSSPCIGWRACQGVHDPAAVAVPHSPSSTTSAICTRRGNAAPSVGKRSARFLPPQHPRSLQSRSGHMCVVANGSAPPRSVAVRTCRVLSLPHRPRSAFPKAPEGSVTQCMPDAQFVHIAPKIALCDSTRVSMILPATPRSEHRADHAAAGAGDR
jgi:hypothetical protein